MRKPIIASMISGIKEAVSEFPNVTLVSNDPKCWISAIYDIINNGKKDSHQPTPSKEINCSYDFDYLAKVFDSVIKERI